MNGRFGKAGELWIVWARFCAVCSGMDWQERLGLSRHGMERCDVALSGRHGMEQKQGGTLYGLSMENTRNHPNRRTNRRK